MWPRPLSLKISIESNLKEVNFLDVTLNLRTNSYRPYRKPNDNPLYISSNNPPNIKRQLPHNISKRGSGISSGKEIFDQAAPVYNDALKASGYKERIKYEPEPASTDSKTQRKWKIIWFNPPNSMNVQTNVARKSTETLSRLATAACQISRAL